MSLENCYKDYCWFDFIPRASDKFEKTLNSGYFVEGKTMFPG